MDVHPTPYSSAATREQANWLSHWLMLRDFAAASIALATTPAESVRPVGSLPVWPTPTSIWSSRWSNPRKRKSRRYAARWQKNLPKPCSTTYLSIDQWAATISDGKVARYYDRESDEIIRQANMKSYEAPYKIILLWCPERMDETSSNHMLKIIEEPPMNTVFLMVSDTPQKIIGTILSRVQQIHVPPIDEASLDAALRQQHPELDDTRVNFLVRNAHGSWNTLLNTMEESDGETEFFHEFQTMMRLAYRPIVVDVKAWSDQMGSRKRPWIITFLQRAQRQIRENFIYNLQMKEITYMNEEEEFFASRFSRFIHQNNVTGIMEELALAQAQIEQNANMKIVLFDMILKLYSLLAKQAPK